MSREIKFRGISTYNGEYVYGDLVNCAINGRQIKDTPYHVNDGLINLIPTEVDQMTIGQFTGLYDMSGVEIYEGDIVRTSQKIDGNFVDVIYKTRLIVFKRFSFTMKPIEPAQYTESMVIGCDTVIEVIGNIHQNPELLSAENAKRNKKTNQETS